MAWKINGGIQILKGLFCAFLIDMLEVRNVNHDYVAFLFIIG